MLQPGQHFIIRSYHGGYTASHPNCKVKHHWAQSVLQWGSTRESWVSNVFFFGPFLTMFWSKTWTWRPIVNIPLPHFFGKQADLWRMLGISNCFFTLFFCFNPRLCGFFFLVLRTCLFLVLPHSMAPFTLNFTETKLSKQMQLSGQT